MSDIRYSVFDFFSYFVPGTITVIVTYIVFIDLEKDFDSISTFLTYTSNTYNLSLGVLFVIFSYITGYIICICFGPLTSLIGKFIKTKYKDLGLRNSEKYALVNELCPKSFSLINEYNRLYLFSHNLAYNLLISSLLLCKHFDVFKSWMLLLPLGMSIFLIIKSLEYKRWRSDLLQSSIELFKLNESLNRKRFD